MSVIRHGDQEFHLSHEEEEKLSHFQMITAFPDEELPKVIQLLQNHGWHLEPALSRFFDGNWTENLEQPAIPERPPTPISTDVTPRSATPFIVSQTGLVPRLPIVKKLPLDYKEKFQFVGLDKRNEELTTHPALFVILLLPRILLRLGMGIFTILWSIITFGFNTNGVSDKAVSKVPNAPVENCSSIDESLELLLGENSELSNFVSKDDFNRIYDECEGGFKYLLFVCLGEISSTDTTSVDVNSQRLIKHVLNDPATLEILRENTDNLRIYMRPAQSLEMWSIAKHFKIRYTPDCLLIGNVLNSNESAGGITRMSVLARLKISSPKKFQNSLKYAIERFNPEMVVNRIEQEELKLARQIKQMQDEAFEESLKRDQVKEEQRRKAEDEARVAEELKLENERQLALLETIKGLKWLHLCTKLIDPQAQSQNVGVKEGSLQFRTPDGKRLVRSFNGNCTLKEVYHIVKCHLFLGTMSPKAEDIIECMRRKIGELRDDEDVLSFKSNGVSDERIKSASSNEVMQMIDDEFLKWNKSDDAGEFDVDFELVSPFPRYRVPYEESIIIKSVPQLWPNGSMLVEYLMSDDEDSE